jgi:hypothetical protein
VNLDGASWDTHKMQGVQLHRTGVQVGGKGVQLLTNLSVLPSTDLGEWEQVDKV